MTEHTPTPWRVEEGTDLIWGACDPDDLTSRGMGYSIVEGKPPHWKPYKPSRDEREANAAFIVKAVNNHEALVQALQALVDQVNDYERVNNLAPNPGRTECWDSVAIAKQVLRDSRT